jgi:hypothetical protein
MKTVIVLIEPGQLEALIDDLEAGLASPGTNTIALVLSEKMLQADEGPFTFPQDANCYIGPIQTVGFRASLREIQKQLYDGDRPN